MDKIRIVLFTNYYWGASLIHEFLEGPLASSIEVVGICIDRASWDEDRSYAALRQLSSSEITKKLHGRIWKEFYDAGEHYYEHCRSLVPELAKKYGIEVFNEKWVNVNGNDEISDSFANILVTQWRPNLMLSAIYGQKIPTDAVRLVTTPEEFSKIKTGKTYKENKQISMAAALRRNNEQFGCYNFHPSTYEWPSRFAGGQFFSDLISATEEGLTYFCVTMHGIQWEYDSGPVHKRSSPIAVFPGINSIELYLSCTQGVIELARKEIQEISFFRQKGE